jgi:hypothetical protein
VRGVRFENFNINGKVVKNAQELGLIIEGDVADVTF